MLKPQTMLDWKSPSIAEHSSKPILASGINARPSGLKRSRTTAVLSNAYCISAVQAPTFTWIQTGHGLVNVPSKAVSKFAQFYSCLPLFANEPSWRLKSSLAVGFPWIPRLAARRLDIFPRTNMQEDKYLQYLPQTWTMCNSLHEGALRAGSHVGDDDHRHAQLPGR